MAGDIGIDRTRCRVKAQVRAVYPIAIMSSRLDVVVGGGRNSEFIAPILVNKSLRHIIDDDD